jgi:hypothetical protein
MDDLSEVTGSEPATNQLKYLDLERLKQPAQDKQKGGCKETRWLQPRGFRAFPRAKSGNFNDTSPIITRSSPGNSSPS